MREKKHLRNSSVPTEIGGVLKTAAKFDIKSVKFTGGEPLLREDLVDIISLVPDSMESSITTNGILLADYAIELKEAGMSRVNISLDSLNPETYKKITGSNRLTDVLHGIDIALDAGLTPIKLNMVMLRGINDQELEDFYRYIRNNRNLVLQSD